MWTDCQFQYWINSTTIIFWNLSHHANKNSSHSKQHCEAVLSHKAQHTAVKMFSWLYLHLTRTLHDRSSEEAGTSLHVQVIRQESKKSPRTKESKIKELDSSLFMKMVAENHLWEFMDWHDIYGALCYLFKIHNILVFQPVRPKQRESKLTELSSTAVKIIRDRFLCTSSPLY